MDRLTSASIILTDRCNMQCTYCYEQGMNTRSKDMTEDMGNKIIDFLINQAKLANEPNISLTFFGGEPTLNVSVMNTMFKYALAQTKLYGMTFDVTIVTNGTPIIDMKYFEFLCNLKNSDIEYSIQLSIDGLPEAQNKNRIMKNGDHSSSSVEANIKIYKNIFGEDFKDRVSIHTTINLDTLPYIYDSYIYFVEILGINNISFMPVHEENWMNIKGDIVLYEDLLIKIMDYIINKVKETNDTTLANRFNISSNCRTKHPDKPCGAGSNFCTIDSDGDIYPCHRFRSVNYDTVIGNISDHIELIDEKRKQYLEYDSSMLIGKYSCAECNNYDCYRCIAANYEYNGNFMLCFAKHCEMQFAQMEANTYLKKSLNIEKPNIDTNGIREDLQELGKALKDNIVPTQEFMMNLNNKVDSLFETNLLLIDMVKALLERNTND